MVVTSSLTWSSSVRDSLASAQPELKRRRIDNVVILERASEVGGVWRDNTYPGCRCDIPSSLYSFSFMPKPDWSDRFATQPEIKQYLVDCVRRLGIESKIRFDADVASATWDGESSGGSSRFATDERLLHGC